MRISDWSSDVCSSDLAVGDVRERGNDALGGQAPARAGQLAFAALRVAQDPWLVAEDRVGRPGERLELEFATQADRAVDPAQPNAARWRFHVGSRRACTGRRSRARDCRTLGVWGSRGVGTGNIW